VLKPKPRRFLKVLRSKTFKNLLVVRLIGNYCEVVTIAIASLVRTSKPQKARGGASRRLLLFGVLIGFNTSD
jgi:hypothetical protein